MTTTTDHEVIVLGRDHIGTIAEGDGMRYYLTQCCGASAKGLEDCIGCRACYREIDPLLGGVPDEGTVLVKGSRDERPDRAACYDSVLDGWWVSTDIEIDWVEIYGDGLPYADWKVRYMR